MAVGGSSRMTLSTFSYSNIGPRKLKDNPDDFSKRAGYVDADVTEGHGYN